MKAAPSASPVRSARDKIKPLAALGPIAERLRRNGEVIVLAHGTFDLLHAGHVRHLEAARRNGTRLIVTVTADKFVNKGPGRPVFHEELRAEMLASLEIVDFVAISHTETSIDAVHTVRPQVYAKGSDYADAEKDITGNIRREREAVEKHGGHVVFTDEITFSSSSLLNRHFPVISPDLREYVDGKRSDGFLDRTLELIEKVQDLRVLVVGDSIIDEYDYVLPLGKPPKENLIATCFQNKEAFAGGVLAAANHVASFCKEVEVLTTIGENDSHWDLIQRSAKPNVQVTKFVRPGKVTTRKVRFVESGYMRKLFEVYHMDDTPLDEDLGEVVEEAIEERARSADLVLVTDFGHGLVTPRVVSTIVDSAPFLAVNSQTNSANAGYNLITKYPRADYICIDAPEARLAVSDKVNSIEHIASQELPRRVACDRFIITTGKQGCICYDREKGVRRIPAFTNTVVDTVGAGDAFLAVTSPMVAAGGDLEHIGFIGNAAGAIKVGIVGHRQSVEKLPLIRYITTLLK